MAGHATTNNGEAGNSGGMRPASATVSACKPILLKAKRSPFLMGCKPGLSPTGIGSYCKAAPISEQCKNYWDTVISVRR